MGLMKRFDGPDHPGERPERAKFPDYLQGYGKTKQTAQIASGEVNPGGMEQGHGVDDKTPQIAVKMTKTGRTESKTDRMKGLQPIMKPYINKVVGLLGPGEFRYFETVYSLINEEITISRDHLKDLLIKLKYNVHNGTHAGKKVLTVEGGAIEEPIHTPAEPICEGQGIFKHFNTYVPPSKAEHAKVK